MKVNNAKVLKPISIGDLVSRNMSCVALAAVLSLVLAFVGAGDVHAQEVEDPLFIRGDLNADGFVNTDDVCLLQCYLYGAECRATTPWTPCSQIGQPACTLAADINDDGYIDMMDDMEFSYNWFYLGCGQNPPAGCGPWDTLKSPWSACGPDPTNP